MRDKLKKHKKKVILFGCLLFIGIVSVSAVTIFPSSEVSFNNTTSGASGMTSTDVQRAIEELHGKASGCASAVILDLIDNLEKIQAGRKFTGTIYRNNTNVLFNGLTYNGEATVWYPTNQGYSSAQEAHADYSTYASQAYCEYDTGSENCTSGTVTLSAGSYETNASNLNKTYYLKHTIINDIVTASYVCFVTDTEHCMQGGDMDISTGLSPYYSTNQTLLESQETWFNNHSGSCGFDSWGSSCDGGGFTSVLVNSNGYVDAYVYHDGDCYVGPIGNSYCYVSS